jgi:hypothetical protein
MAAHRLTGAEPEGVWDGTSIHFTSPLHWTGWDGGR